MFTSRRIHSNLSFADKIYSMGYILLFLVLMLGIISMFAMYSTAGGKFDYHTKSHILRFGVFFVLLFFVAFFELKFWFQSSLIIYIIFLILLLGVKYFGLTSSGSQRWINLYIINLQPSELMKIGLIMFLSKYYHRIPVQDVNKINVPYLYSQRRDGDCAISFADNSLAKKILNWNPRSNLSDMCRDGRLWHKSKSKKI